MNLATTDIITVLFGALTAFVVINTLINFVLHLTRPKGLYKFLAGYWCSILVFFLVQANFQKGELQIAMAYSFVFLPVSILGIVAFSSISKKFPLKEYIFVYGFSVLCALGAYMAGGDFTSMAIPLSLASAAPFAHSAFLVLWEYRGESTRLQKVMGVIFILLGIHCINFAIFRMGEGNQLWGWLAAYAGYDILGILMPAIELERSNLQENQRLERMVESRTAGLKSLSVELDRSAQKSDALLKVMLHDIAYPLKVIEKSKGRHLDEESSKSFDYSIKAIHEIIINVQEQYGKSGDQELKIMLDQTEIIECMENALYLYRNKAKEKMVKLKLNVELSPKAFIVANKATLTHSVFSNFISHSINNSPERAQIQFDLSDQSGAVELKAIGADELAPKVSEPAPEVSIMKSFVKECGGRLDGRQRLIFNQSI